MQGNAEVKRQHKVRVNNHKSCEGLKSSIVLRGCLLCTEKNYTQSTTAGILQFHNRGQNFDKTISCLNTQNHKGQSNPSLSLLAYINIAGVTSKVATNDMRGSWPDG